MTIAVPDGPKNVFPAANVSHASVCHSVRNCMRGGRWYRSDQVRCRSDRGMSWHARMQALVSRASELQTCHFISRPLSLFSKSIPPRLTLLSSHYTQRALRRRVAAMNIFRLLGALRLDRRVKPRLSIARQPHNRFIHITSECAC